MARTCHTVSDKLFATLMLLTSGLYYSKVCPFTQAWSSTYEGKHISRQWAAWTTTIVTNLSASS